MKDHEKRELVSRITAVALEYRDAEQLRAPRRRHLSDA